MFETKTLPSLTALMQPLSASCQEAHREAPATWQETTLTDLTAVSELLDCLEGAGYEQRRLSDVEDAFVVRWR